MPELRARESVDRPQRQAQAEHRERTGDEQVLPDSHKLGKHGAELVLEERLQPGLLAGEATEFILAAAELNVGQCLELRLGHHPDVEEIGDLLARPETTPAPSPLRPSSFHARGTGLSGRPHSATLMALASGEAPGMDS
jgi:hypothetical protein